MFVFIFDSRLERLKKCHLWYMGTEDTLPECFLGFLSDPAYLWLYIVSYIVVNQSLGSDLNT
uniref:Uncharacterized protein n=1 Tax=Arundo donax TaxID=35708 RepID=A0A0A8Y809_ARUDO